VHPFDFHFRAGAMRYVAFDKVTSVKIPSIDYCIDWISNFTAWQFQAKADLFVRLYDSSTSAKEEPQTKL
jgi:hypothetical protein